MKRRIKKVFLYGCLAALAACGNSPPNAGGDMANMGGMDMTRGVMDMAMAGGMIPDPGTSNMVDINFGSVEPNDIPSQATPLGVAKMGDIMVWVSGNNAGGSNTTDYFVFKTSPMTGQFSMGFSGICWSPAITNLNATLWKVAAGQQVLPPVHSWVGSGSCVKSMMGDAPLEASTEYLFAVQATGGAGMYSA
jgi:hypothetical protein